MKNETLIEGLKAITEDAPQEQPVEQNGYSREKHDDIQAETDSKAALANLISKATNAYNDFGHQIEKAGVPTSDLNWMYEEVEHIVYASMRQLTELLDKYIKQ